MTFRQRMHKFLRRTDGATTIEFSMIAGGIFLLILPVVTTTGKHLDSKYETISQEVVAAVDPESSICATDPEACGQHILPQEDGNQGEEELTSGCAGGGAVGICPVFQPLDP